MNGRDEAVARRDRDRAVLAGRAAVLARRGGRRLGPDAAAGAAYLVCACGGERYGLPLSAAAQVLPMRPCTRMPGAVPALIGLVALSGRIVGVVGLARALGRAESDPQPGAGHLVVLRGAAPLALAVDRVLGVARTAAPVDDADPGGLGNEAASGYAPAAGGSPDFVALDLPRLLRRAIP